MIGGSIALLNGKWDGMRRRSASRMAAYAGAALALAAPSATSAAQDARIRVAQGQLAGKKLESGGTLFAGIPYAKPPVGQRRWKAPEAPLPWTGVRQATAFGPTCMQPDMGWNKWDAARGGEDCLSLNVWTPAGRGKALPVMIWFHGGGFVGGSGSAPTYDGTALTSHGVILVTVNYRLGVMGFLAHPELSSENGGSSGNYGVLDQVAALAWVHRNIAQFGGDPANVTVFGQSAGSISTGNLVTVLEARSYFKRVILQSGTPFGVGNLPPLKEAEQNNAAFGRLPDLRALPAADVIARWSSFAAAAPAARRAIPVVDGRVLRQQPAASYLAGAARDVPLLLGSVVREIAPAAAGDVLPAAQAMLGSDAPAIVSKYEKAGTDAIAGDAGTQLMTDMQFRCGTVVSAGAARSAWLYHFLEPFPGRPAPAHSGEVFYVFNTVPGAQPGAPVLDQAQRKLGETMRLYWTNFAKTGDPNGAGLPEWPRYTANTQRYIDLAASGVISRDHLRGQACAPWISFWTARRRSN